MKKNSITLFDTWISRYPETARDAILDGLFSKGTWPDDPAEVWRMVRVEYDLPFKKKEIKFGVVRAELLPHIGAAEILCLKQCGVRRIPCFHLNVSAMPAHGTYTLGFMEEKNANRMPLGGTKLTKGAS